MATKTTLKELAAIGDPAPSTISSETGQGTKQGSQEIARANGHIANNSARSFKPKRGPTLGAIVPNAVECGFETSGNHGQQGVPNLFDQDFQPRSGTTRKSSFTPKIDLTGFDQRTVLKDTPTKTVDQRKLIWRPGGGKDQRKQ